MKTYARHASARWLGTRQRGKGVINTPSSNLKMALHPAHSDAEAKGTNPAELMAAAIASSFSLTLADELTQAGYKPRQIETLATVSMDLLATGWTVTQILLAVTATVPRAAECDFVDATLRAKANCPIARALNVSSLMKAKLTRHDERLSARPLKNL